MGNTKDSRWQETDASSTHYHPIRNVSAAGVGALDFIYVALACYYDGAINYVCSRHRHL